jgi:hypothetical protein
MKRSFRTTITLLLFSFITMAAFAQEEQPSTVAKWASWKGYCVVEGNINEPLQHTIRFYTNTDVLLYTETLSGVKLKLDKPKVKMKLKKVLENAVLAWEQKKAPESEKSYVAAILR